MFALVAWYQFAVSRVPVGVLAKVDLFLSLLYSTWIIFNGGGIVKCGAGTGIFGIVGVVGVVCLVGAVRVLTLIVSVRRVSFFSFWHLGFLGCWV